MPAAAVKHDTLQGAWLWFSSMMMLAVQPLTSSEEYSTSALLHSG